MEHTDKQPLDDIDGGVIHHVGEEGNHPQHKTRVNFAEKIKRGRGRGRGRERGEISVVRCVLHRHVHIKVQQS